MKSLQSPQLKIILIDDDQDNLDTMGDALALNGYPADCYVNPKDAMQVCEKNRYDVVITDYKMPEISGLDLLHKVGDKIPNACFILISSYDVADHSQRFPNFQFFRKPIEIWAVLDILNNLSRKKPHKKKRE